MMFALVSVGQQRNFLSYSLQDGLPQSQIYAIAQDKDGYLWIGTQGAGIARFDGENFERASIPLSDNYINAMIMYRGKTWIGGNTAVSISSKDTTYTLAWPNGLSHKVTSLSADNQGVVWVGTEKGLFFVETQKTSLQLKKYQKGASENELQNLDFYI